MKRLMFLIMTVVLIWELATAVPGYLGVYQTKNWLQFEIYALDTVSGQWRKPDSVQLNICYGRAPNVPSFATYSGADIVAATWIDSMKNAWETQPIYTYHDSVGRIDADSGNGNYNGILRTYYQTKTFNFDFHFVIADSSFTKAINQAAYDSTLNAIKDANKANFKATGFATSTQGDSVTNAIKDANKANFKASGFATSADFWPMKQNVFLVDAAGTNTRTQFVADSASLGTNIAVGFVDQKITVRQHTDAVWLNPISRGITRISSVAGNDTFTVTDSLPQAFAANDSVWLTGDIEHTWATLPEAAKASADSTIKRDSASATGTPGTLGSVIKSAGGSGGMATLPDSLYDTLTAIHAAVNLRPLTTDLPTITQAGLDSLKATAKRLNDSLTSQAWAATGGSETWSTTQRDSLLNAILTANKVNFGQWTSTQRDSILNTILTANKINFGMWTSTQRDSLLNAITATNKANFMRWTAAQRDSLLNTILDANKVNFMRWTTSQRDSVLNAITATNKVNFGVNNWTTAQRDSILNAIAAANKVNFGINNWTTTQRDSILNALVAANKLNFGAWNTTAQRDSILNAIATVNKVNFGQWNSTQRDSILNAITTTNKANFMRWTTAQRDSVLNAILDANKVNMGRWTAVQRDSILAAIVTIESKTNKLTFDAQDSLVIDYSKIPPAIAALDPQNIADIAAAVIAGVPTAGSGAYPCTLFVRSAGIAIQGITVRANNSTETATAAQGITNSNGRVIFNLDVATYKVRTYAAGLVQTTNPQSVSVLITGAHDTLQVSTFDPGSPLTPWATRVYGKLQSISFGAIGATIKARLQAPNNARLTRDSTIISPYEVTASSDSVTGNWHFDLIPSDSITASNLAYKKYTFTIYKGNTLIATKKDVTIPAISPFKMTF